MLTGLICCRGTIDLHGTAVKIWPVNLTGTRILVTGGAGFVGSHVCPLLNKNGGDVVVVDDLSVGSETNVPDDIRLINQDITEQEAVDIVSEVNPEVILHLAAIHYVPYCNDNPGEAHGTNVVGTRHILEGARRADVNKVVFASSAAVYPPREGPNPEESELEPIDVYGETKVLGEDLCRLFAADTGTPTAAARLFNIFGTNETNPHLIPAIIDQVKSGKEVELGNLTPRRDFVFVTDVAEALGKMIVEDPVTTYRAYNVGTGQDRSVEEVFKTVKDLVEGDVELVQDENRMRESDRSNLEADPFRIRSELGWEPSVSFEDGIRQVLTGQGIETN